MGNRHYARAHAGKLSMAIVPLL